jgi:hypothetical protein
MKWLPCRPWFRHIPLRTLLPFLLLGAAVNVAVAWGLGAWSPYTNSSGRDASDVELARVAEYSETPKSDETIVATGWGIRNTCTPVRDPVLDAERKRFFRPGEYGTVFFATPAVCVIESGFPCLTVKSVHVLHSSKAGAPLLLESRGGVLLRNHAVIEGHPIGWVPVLPGFAINTILCAAILWRSRPLFDAPFAFRRRLRLRKGQCPECAYPIGASDLCTECGKPVQSTP